MPSSIFSFSHPQERAPDQPWLRIAILSMLMTVVVAGGFELAWRQLGHRPCAWPDTIAYWATLRSELENTDENHIVALGASFMQQGLSTNVCEVRFPAHPVTQLAINGGGSPIAVLCDLADHSDFKGLVLCSMRESWLPRPMWASQHRYVNFYHHGYAPDSEVGRFCGRLVRSNLVLQNPNLRLDTVLRSFVTEEPFPNVAYFEMNDRRWIQADYSKTDVDERRQAKLLHLEQEGTNRVWADHNEAFSPLPDLEASVKRIQSRGGQVVFIKMPASKRFATLENKQYPRDQYWDRFAASTSAITIHFEDIESFKSLQFLDTAHLDRDESIKFTHFLLDELVNRGILPIDR